MTQTAFARGPRAIRVLLVLTSLAWTSIAHAQAGTIAGTVVDAKSGLPISDVTVAGDGMAGSSRTGTRGEFRLSNVPGSTVRLRLTRIGYLAVTHDASVGDMTLRIAMSETSVKLDAVVVTGTAGEAQRRTLGNAVGLVDVGTQIVLAGAPAKLQDMMSSSVPGVRIMRASGTIGSGGTTRIRGVGSLSLSNEPLIYIDGVRSNNTAAAPSFGFVGQESPSRVNDLNPQEIESIEVLKGPSAATIYGTEASNGVIQIITKRGRAGRPTIETHMDQGWAWLSDPEGRYPLNYYLKRGGDYRNPADIKAFNVQTFQTEHGFPKIFSTGRPWGGGGSISGGSDQLRYFFSGDYKRDEGAVDYNWQNKFNSRANVGFTTTDAKLRIDLGLGTVRFQTRGGSGRQPITTSILWACNFPWCEPTGPDTTTTGWNGPGHGFQFYRPEDYYGVEGFDNVERSTFSLQVNHRPLPWFRHRVTIGPDFTNNKSSNLVFRNTIYPAFFAASLGQKQSQDLRSIFFTADYGASADWTMNQNMVFTTSGGAQYYYKQFDTQISQGFEFPVPGPGDVGSGARRDASEAFQENKTKGVYGQEQFAWKNRLFLTAAVRSDGNSAFGSNFKSVTYPKFSASWVVSEEPFFSRFSNMISELKLRAAWGRAGQQPDVFSAIQTYGAAVGSLGLGGVTPRNFGNQNLKPEIGEETELGFDAGLFNHRVGVEFTYYNKDIKDAIISAPLKPSRGFPGSQFLNIGKTRNRGIELGIDNSPVNNERWGLDLRGTIATNDAKIVSLGGVPPTFIGASYIQQWNVEGFAPGSYFYKNVLSSTIVPDTTCARVAGACSGAPTWVLPLAKAGTEMCEGGKDLGRGDGSVVPCATAPRLYAGRPSPSWNGSFSSTLRFGEHIRLLALVDYLGGIDAVVGDVGAQHTFFRSSFSSIAGDNSIVQGYRNDPSGPGVTGLFDAGFARLRTVALTYDLPTNYAKRLSGASRGSFTISAENLAFLWRAQPTAYGAAWVDPELLPNRVNAADPSGNYNYTQESWPQLARINTILRLTF